MLASFIVLVREGFEAALILGLMYTYLDKVGHRHHFGYVTGGALAGIAASAVLGFVMVHISGILLDFGPDLIGLAATLIAVGVLTAMTLWMRVHGREVKGQVEQRLAQALSTQNLWLIFALALSSVFREGGETVLFLWGLLTQALGEGQAAQAAVGGLLGLATAVGLAFVIFRGFRRVNLRRFFDVTSVLLLLIAGGLLVQAVGRLQGLGWLPLPERPLWDTSHWIDEGSFVGSLLRGLFGYHARPSFAEVGTYVGYLTAVIGLLLWMDRRHATARSMAP